MPIKFLYSLFCLLTGVLSAMSSRAAGPGVINLLPSDYRAANKNWAVAEDDAGTLYAGNDKGLLEFGGCTNCPAPRSCVRWPRCRTT